MQLIISYLNALENLDSELEHDSMQLKVELEKIDREDWNIKFKNI